MPCSRHSRAGKGRPECCVVWGEGTALYRRPVAAAWASPIYNTCPEHESYITPPLSPWLGWFHGHGGRGRGGMLQTPAMVCRVWPRLAAVMCRFYREGFFGPRKVIGCTPPLRCCRRRLRRLRRLRRPRTTFFPFGRATGPPGHRAGIMAPRFELICPSRRGCDEGKRGAGKITPGPLRNAGGGRRVAASTLRPCGPRSRA